MSASPPSAAAKPVARSPNSMPHEISPHTGRAGGAHRAEPDSAHRHHHVPADLLHLDHQLHRGAGCAGGQAAGRQRAAAGQEQHHLRRHRRTARSPTAARRSVWAACGPTVKRLCAKEPLPVVIQADENASSGMVIRVIDEAKLGGARTSAWPRRRVDPATGRDAKGLPERKPAAPAWPVAVIFWRGLHGAAVWLHPVRASRQQAGPHAGIAQGQRGGSAAAGRGGAPPPPLEAEKPPEAAPEPQLAEAQQQQIPVERRSGSGRWARAARWRALAKSAR